MGRRRKANRGPLMTYNLTIDTVKNLDKLKMSGETQDALIRRLIKLSESCQDVENLESVLNDTFGTLRDVRNQKALIETRLKSIQGIHPQADALLSLIRIF